MTRWQRSAAWLSVPVRWYLGGLFILACLHKIADPHAFAIDVATYDILPLVLVNLVALTLPWIELLAGAMLLAGWRTRAGAWLIAAMMLVFLIAILIALGRGLDMSCGCFASQSAADDPISLLTVLRDSSWLALAIFVLAFDRGKCGLDAWFARKEMPMRILVFIITALLPMSALAQTPTCNALTSDQRQIAQEILASEYLYECCDQTIAQCLDAEPTCALAPRLADNVCRRVAAGQDVAGIRRALSRRARSMIGGQSQPAEINLDGAPAVGAENAPVTIVVYACPRCPYCRILVPQLYHAIHDGALKGQARLVFRIFPIRGHEGSTEAGLAFTAAAEMGEFWPFMLDAYQHFDAFAESDMIARAASLGLDRDQFAAKMKDPATREILVASKKEGIANGVEETPTLFINGRRWVGDLEIGELTDAAAEEHDRVTGEIWVPHDVH